jgi:hypothetical protein
MSRYSMGVAASATIICGLTACAATTERVIALRDMGSFHIGGREVALSGKPVMEVRRTPDGPPTKVDPNGDYQVEHMYVQYYLPAQRRGQYPLLLWHGGGLTGASFETTPDGRPGWLTYFIRQGWDTYVSDAVERGRAGWAPRDVFFGDPVFLTKQDPFERFRIGAGAGSYNKDPAKRNILPGNQFPFEAYDNFARQFVPRWLSTDDQIHRAYAALVEKVCPCVLLIHSQAGQWGYKVAQAHPDKIKAIVAIEPAAAGDADKATALKSIPILVVWGDYIGENPRWSTIRDTGMKFTQRIEAAGGRVKVVDLPTIGIRGNSHMVMMDKNNMAVADLIQQWLGEQGLYR